MPFCPVEDSEGPEVLSVTIHNVNFIICILKNPRIKSVNVLSSSNHLLSITIEVWWIEMNHVEWWVSLFAGQTHHTVSATFTGSCRRSALFNISRAVALAERRGRESHCCYGNEEHVSGGWGALWQKTRPDPTTPALIGPRAKRWCVLTTRRSPTNTRELLPESLYSHYVWQHSAPVITTERGEHLHIQTRGGCDSLPQTTSNDNFCRPLLCVSQCENIDTWYIVKISSELTCALISYAF